MKTLCFILSLYVLFLATAPCCLDDYCIDDLKTEQTSNHLQDHKNSDCNTCSPFFTCGTCSGFVISIDKIELNDIPLFKYQCAAIYKVQFVNDFFAKIWQPPKIS